jgi:hypothetical protein
MIFKRKNKARLTPLAVVVVIIVFAFVVWFVLFFNPLPNDEELIAHFNAHRSDIEALVKSYRDYHGVGGRPWERNPETLELKRKAGVERVHQVGALWLPNPYLPETDALIERTIRSGSGRCFFRRYGSLEIEIDVNRYFRKSLRYPGAYFISKSLFFYPEAPRIENGWLLAPARKDGNIELHLRVVPSLDSYPPEWKKGECVVRRLEAQWFIHMCRAA